MGALTDEQIAQIGAYLETLARRNANWADPSDSSELEFEFEKGVILATTRSAEPAEPMEYQVHLGHILTSWNDTPGEVGLVTILQKEATIAREHAEYA